MNPTSSPAGRRRWLVMAAAGAIVGALFYMAPWKSTGPVMVVPPTAPSLVSPLAPAETMPGSPNAVSVKTVTAKTRPLTVEEKAAVERQIEEARAEVTRLRKTNRKFLNPVEDESGRTEFVNVEAFTAEQIDAFYTFLTKQGQVFEPGSPAALAFRKQADGLVYELRKFPRMAVKKLTSRGQEIPSFTVIKLAEGTPFPVVEKGTVVVHGRNRTVSGMTGVDDPALDELFVDAPETK